MSNAIYRHQRLSAKLVRRWGQYGTLERPCPTLAHWCEGCGHLHDFATDVPFHNGARWQWNGNADAPGFTPSMNIRIGPYPDGEEGAGRIDVCHYFLTNGEMSWLGDCTHALANTKRPLVDIPSSALCWSEEIE